MSAPIRLSAMDRYRLKSCMNQSVSRFRRNGIFPFDNVHSRLGARGRACDSEGNGDGPRCVLTLHPQTDCSTRNQRS